MRNWYNKSIEETVKYFKTNIDTGHTEEEIIYMRNKYGKNEILEKKKKTIFSMILEQLKNILIIILLIAGGLSFFLGEEIDAVIILAIVILNTVMGIVQESKAEKALEALKKMSAPKAKVIREGSMMVMESSELVPGDITAIEAGDFIPADGRLFEAVNLKVEESALTGESLPVDKTDCIIDKEDVMLGDRKNQVASGTIVTYGRGKYIVTGIGMNTEVGKIADMITESKELSTPLQRKLAQFGKILGIIALLICIVIFGIGVLEGRDIFDMFLMAVSLAVAAIPEGLPAIVTIVLAIGVQRLVKKRAVIRKLPAVETLGSASVICSDKTGTLTQNKMTLVKISDTKRTYDMKSADIEKNSDIAAGLRAFALANTSHLVNENGKWDAVGDPTETSLVIAAARKGLIKGRLEEEYVPAYEIPFDSERKMMSSINKKEEKYYVFTKGAPDEIMKRCSFYLADDKINKMTDETRDGINEMNSSMGSDALRVLGAAYKTANELPETIDSESIENDLIFIGLAGIIDPPREEVKKAIEKCKIAGIKTVMITGDHKITAAAIASDLEILEDNGLAVSGADLEVMSQEELCSGVKGISVYARVSPEHKVRIVKAWQSHGEIVAMTGDGVNDAPALKTADIGCAMGITGTDVAKGAADMVLTDDNFTTIVEAVHEGRGIYDNIKKSIHFLLSCNLGEIVAIFTAIILNWATPLLPIQILWINLITDSFPALALGMEPVSKSIMYEKPRSRSKGIFADGLGIAIGGQGLLIGTVTIISFLIGWKIFGRGLPEADSTGIARTMAFATLAISQLIHAYSIRSSESIFRVGLFSNKWMNRAFLLSLFLQVSVITVPYFSGIFRTVSLDSAKWLIILALSFIPFLIEETIKLFTKKRR